MATEIFVNLDTLLLGILLPSLLLAFLCVLELLVLYILNIKIRAITSKRKANSSQVTTKEDGLGVPEDPSEGQTSKDDPIYTSINLSVLKTREELFHNTAEYATIEDHHGISVSIEMIDNRAYAQHFLGHSTP